MKQKRIKTDSTTKQKRIITDSTITKQITDSTTNQKRRRKKERLENVQQRDRNKSCEGQNNYLKIKNRERIFKNIIK